MFTPNCSAPMNRLLNRSLYFIQAPFRARYESSQVFAHILMQETKVALTLSVQSTSVGKPHSQNQHGVAKSAKRWPVKGLSSDTIMIPSHLTVLHVGFMCEGISILVQRIRFFPTHISSWVYIKSIKTALSA